VLVYLVRHAEAASGEPDELRPLTEEGRKQARALGKRLAAQEPPTCVRTSPLLRARQTGEAIARAAGVRSEPDDRLAPGATAADVREVAAECEAPVAIVGHQPDCGLIAIELTGAETPFPPAAAVRLEL
jgi:phosphohistidine phosphatase SixA